MLCDSLIVIIQSIPDDGMLLRADRLIWKQFFEFDICEVYLLIRQWTCLLLLLHAIRGLLVFILHHYLWFAFKLFNIIRDYIIIYN